MGTELHWSARFFGVLILAFASSGLAAERLRQPLPLDLVADARQLDPTSVEYSPDGLWVAHVYQVAAAGDDNRISAGFSATGVSFWGGTGDRHVRLTRIADGRHVELSARGTSSWGPSWSPDGEQLAFYSDAGGEAGLWVWCVSTGKARRIGSHIVRPYSHTDQPRWDRSGRQILMKLLPDKMKVAEANALAPREKVRPYPRLAKDSPSVYVLSSDDDRDRTASGAALDRPSEIHFAFGDLALVDVASGRATRIAERTHVRAYRIAPDGRNIAYSVHKGWLADSNQPIYDLYIWNVASRSGRLLVSDVKLRLGHEISWSPDGQILAYAALGAERDRHVHMVRTNGTRISFETVKGEGDARRPAPGVISDAPLWKPGSAVAYSLASGNLWKFDGSSGQASPVIESANYRLTGLVARHDSDTIFEGQGGSIIAFSQKPDDLNSFIVAVDPTSGDLDVLFQNGRQSISGGSVDVGPGGEIGYAAEDPQHMADLWAFDPRTRKQRQVTRLNPELDRYAVGTRRRITWTSGRGEPLEGVLILPPGWTPGKRVPLFLYVYGGTRVGGMFNNYSLRWGESPIFNMHVLSTRGYAIFHPDIPVRTGEVASDFIAAVMPGVDAVIAGGYADPDRLAIGGQSYGSFTTWSIISQTTRFKAAITTANVILPDLFTDYLAMLDDGSAARTGYLEKGQGNMGGDPWTLHDRYLRNSPMFRLDEVETPLLMGQGDEDGDLSASNQMFVALRRLGQKVEYRIYRGEEHVMQYRANVIDFWTRALSFLEENVGRKKAALPSLQDRQ